MKKDVGTAWNSIKVGRAKIRALLLSEKLFTLETALLFFPVLTALLGCAGFLVGLPITAFWFYGAFLLSALLLIPCAPTLSEGLKRAAAFTAIVAACAFCSSLFLFIDGLGNTDSIAYHAPGTMLMAEGWNPVLCSSVEAVTERYALPENGVWRQHIALLPKMNWVFAASAYRATGCMSMGTLSCLLLMISVGWSAARFFTTFFSENRWLAAVFALGAAFSAKMGNSLAGCNDYYVYAGLAVLIFSLFTYLKTGAMREWVLAALALPWCWCVKMGGIPWSFMMLAFFFGVLIWRRFSGRASAEEQVFTVPMVCLVCAAIAGFIIGFSPYITNWVNYTSPFYPEHTFSAAVKALPEHDITGSLTGNADAESMGHLARFAYAWISKDGTLALLRLWYGKAFYPEFYVFGGVEGMGSSMRLLLAISFAGILFARRSLLGFAYALILLSVAFVPVKFIGYARYTPQVWLLPFIGCFAAACHPGRWLSRYVWVRRGAFWGVVIAMSLFTLLSIGRCGVMLLCKLANEESRLASIESARESPVEGVCVLSQYLFRDILANPDAAEPGAARCWYGEYALQRFGVPYRRLLSSREGVDATEPRLFMLYETLLFLRTLEPAEYAATLNEENIATLTSRSGMALPVGTVLKRLPGYICRATAFNFGNFRRGLPGLSALEAASSQTTHLPEY